MCFIMSFVPATFWAVVSYFVLFSSTKADGPVKTFGRVLGIWALVIAGGAVIAGAYLTTAGLCPIGAMLECSP